TWAGRVSAARRPGARARPPPPRTDKRIPMKQRDQAMPPSSRTGAAVRVAAAGVLHAVLQGRSLKAELASALPAIADPRDRALVEAICFAALRNRARYDAALAAWMPRPLGRRD